MNSRIKELQKKEAETTIRFVAAMSGNRYLFLKRPVSRHARRLLRRLDGLKYELWAERERASRLRQLSWAEERDRQLEAEWRQLMQ